MKVVLESYDAHWPHDFEGIRTTLAGALGDLAVRIDHIGSTSVPSMGAKDCIDIQVTVASLEDTAEIKRAFERIGFAMGRYQTDHVPPGSTGDARDWTKLVFSPPGADRLCNVHVREAGRANQRYALLFRDYLRANDDAAAAWFEMKRRLAEHHPDDLATYGYLKDAATDVLMLAAERWAADSGWTP